MNNPIQNEAETQDLKREIPFPSAPRGKTNDGTSISIKDPDTILGMIVLLLACLGLAFLGIGPDGHTASLFPNASALEERERRAVTAPHEDVERVTMTLPVLAAATRVVYLVLGEEKAEAVRRAFAGPPDPAIPASLLRSEHGETIVLLVGVPFGTPDGARNEIRLSTDMDSISLRASAVALAGDFTSPVRPATWGRLKALYR